LDSPTKVSKKLFVKLTDDERLPESPDTIGDDDEEVDEEAQLRELRKKFVGEVDLPESTCFHVFDASLSHERYQVRSLCSRSQSVDSCCFPYSTTR
jgi:hypothetical protein